MSIAIMSQLFKAHLGSTNRKMLAVRLADFADDDGKGIWPTVGRLARETELSERTVQRILSEFVDEGLLIVRKKGGWKPGEGTRYDFNMSALGRLQAAKMAVEGCHGVTRDTVTPVTAATGTGDTDDAEGCHGDTQTVIEPPIEPSDLREGAREAEGQESQTETEQSIEKGFWALVKDWPGFAGMPKEPAKRAWFALTADERREAAERFPRWLQLLKAQKKSHTPAPSTYFGEKLWMDVPAQDEAAKPVNAMAAPFGKLWSAARISELLMAPTGIIAPPTQFQLSLIKQGKTTLDEVRAEQRMRCGWPSVNTMHERARERQGWLCPLALEEAAQGFQQVHRDSEQLAVWRREHQRRGWPFPEGRLPDWVYFPPIEGGGDPDLLVAEAVERFRDQISDYLANRSKGDDHAA
ncbi:helix-turn-helix domain-containing protein [Sinorhizobium meliloti]|uniref:helix-turn-helix domain-containing protein n=1 Tax=Rhizobium meliloti TaxID=382 RepID=UPI000B4978C7|nr:helix-turn-helix domain-containing protein [Sinorhizobium meliloti]ASQ10656.1 helix-turn-helix domain-containing protein [Sinorhizobium meliloti]MQU81511.1 helix-turn-helix domain-containing protein [Sinorhizobium meliloti]MQU87261.1 helix-turn-helix domain-containing protein [Sinorhizobium meliloti]